MRDTGDEFTACGSSCQPGSQPWPHTMIWGQCAKAFRRYQGERPLLLEEYAKVAEGVALRRRIIVVDEWEEVDDC